MPDMDDKGGIKPSKYKKMSAPVKKEPFMVEKADGSIGQWGNPLKDNEVAEKQIKLSQKTGDVMPHTELKNLIAKSGMQQQHAKPILDAAQNLGQLTPDQGDFVKKLKSATSTQSQPAPM